MNDKFRDTLARAMELDNDLAGAVVKKKYNGQKKETVGLVNELHYCLMDMCKEAVKPGAKKSNFWHEVLHFSVIILLIVNIAVQLYVKYGG